MFETTFVIVGCLTPKSIGSWLVLIISRDLSSSNPYLENKCFSGFWELGAKYFVKLTPVPLARSGSQTEVSGRLWYSRVWVFDPQFVFVLAQGLFCGSEPLSPYV
jgi:hypothetical protein